MVSERFAQFRKASPQLETQNSFFSMAVGLVFIANWLCGVDLYTRFPTVYQYMGFFPMWTWGAIYALAGLTHFLSVVFERQKMRKRVLLVKAGLWMFFSVCVIRGDALAFTGWIYLILSFSAAVAFLNLKRRKNESLPHTSFAP
jgi:hypothetical protein